MNYEETKAVVQEKFLSSELVTAFLCDAKILHPEWVKKDRLLCIVEYGDEKAVFCLFTSSYPPKSFTDLSIEIVLPIDINFKCEIDNKPSDPEAVLYLNLQSNSNKYKFEIQMTPRVDNFVDDLFRGIEAVSKMPTQPEFVWLKKYQGKNEDDIISQLSVVPRSGATHSQSSAPVAIRESLIKRKMYDKELEYTYTKTFTVFCGTWNVNDKSPVLSLEGWLNVDEEPPDIYAVGFQELDLSKETFIFDQTVREEEWSNAVVRYLNIRAKYVILEKVRLIGMLLMVLIKQKHKAHVHNVVFDTVGTGIMGKMGNKGGVSIRFDLHNTSICIVNSHLAAHVEEYERRSQDFRDICNRTRFQQLNQQAKAIKDHDQIYWIGDLNYRITEMDPNTVKQLINENNFEAVLKYDQLKQQHKNNSVFAGYTEGPITFKPTYKYDPGTDNWDSSEKNRAPAWCDRIFWKGDGITQKAYRSHPSLNISDHKPVSAIFNSIIKVIDEEKYRKVYEDVIKQLDKLENELIPQVKVDMNEIDFGTVKYLELQMKTIIIKNTGKLPVEFEFIKKLDEASFCKEWLIVEPYKRCICADESCEIIFKVHINKISACKLNAGTDELYDILVLHLYGGKDIFITVTGTYERSCFGCSIEVLVNLNMPIKEVPIKQLVELESKRHQPVSSQSTYSIPKEVWFLVDHIYLHGLKQPNLFEQPGLHSEILQIRDWLDSGSMDPIPGCIHSVAEALLLLLESTADPIIPYNLQSVCLRASANYLQCRQIVSHLPEFRKNVFLYLCEFLQEALQHSAENGLDANTLSSLFGAIFLRDNPNQTQEPQSRINKQVIEKKKAQFVHHFLVNDHSELIFTR
ncbi:type II inositol 1,4,5-trisphosphate 5-phosphatase-like [Achroia grisella]|uniref:type II inositol 1,4,5-trisphosphate 5-phosphatase-like n=1 Tax=Achroia grisella TaxID=688607 RepID=UPI0027D1ED18|nr:type II inositol 1,4,5-trisphosphate 5-phosphatase-like [Achroia grisella]